MASILQVETLQGLTSGSNANTVIVPSGQTLKANGHIMQMQSYQISSGTTAQATSLIPTAITFTIDNVKADSILAIQISVQDLIETGGYQYARLYSNTKSAYVTDEWIQRQTSGNAGWRGVLATSTHQISGSSSVSAGSNTFTLYMRSNHGSSWYINYNGGSSFVNVWEIAQ